MLREDLRAAPRPLLFFSALFFFAAYFATRFPDTPGAGAGSYVSTVLIALPSLVALFRYLGARRASLSLLVLAAFAYTIESIGVTTGVPYGSFYYGDALGEKALGVVPYLLPVSYLPLVIGAFAAAWSTEGRGPDLGRASSLVFRSAVLLVLVDGVLDPGAAALGFWVWPAGGAYYGVPVSNYAGWLLSGALASVLLLLTGRPRSAPPPAAVDSVLLALGFWIGVAVFSGLLVPAVLGTALFALFLRRRRLLRTAARAKAAPAA
jgi:bisanhydrobacterioruberin hydratase